MFAYSLPAMVQVHLHPEPGRRRPVAAEFRVSVGHCRAAAAVAVKTRLHTPAECEGDVEKVGGWQSSLCSSVFCFVDVGLLVAITFVRFVVGWGFFV